MFRVLLLMLILLASLILGPYFADKQGYVLIETSAYRYEMSVTMLVILFVIAMAILYVVEWIITRFLRLSNNTYSWFSRRKRLKAQKQTLEGLMRMNEGDYAKAEKLIGKNAKHSEKPILNLITAAKAAQQRGDDFSANRYLMEATELAGADNLIVEIARTHILLQQHKLPAARSSVDSLLEMADRNKEVLKLAVEIYLKSKAYQALDNILDKVEVANIYSDSEFNSLQHKTINGLLNEKMTEESADGLLAWWHSQPRKRHNDINISIALIQRLIDCNDHESAYDLCLKTIKNGDKDTIYKQLSKQIIRLQPEDNSKLLKLVEKQRKKQSKADKDSQSCIYRMLGYLYVRNDDFTKATQAFKHMLEQQMHFTANDITMAAYVFEQVGEKPLAEQLQAQHLKTVIAIPTKNVTETK